MTARSLACRAAVIGGLGLACACPRSGGVAARADAIAEPEAPGFHVGWDPAAGRGPIAQILPNGDRYTVCLHCGYPGYTGGLVIGGHGGSGFEWVPATPIPGFPAINLFCAQDESLMDRGSCREYDFGWSQNFGTGDDGVPLLYQGGQILEAGPDRVILGTTNAAGCYSLTRFLRWGMGETFISMATTIRNTCDHPVAFDFWTGDDPWLGRYRSAEGDVGWYDAGLVEHETAVASGAFHAGGLYDLGNAAAGEVEGTFSNAADFILPDPAHLPDRVIFASGFLHDVSEVVPDAPLDPTSMIALNLGWIDVRLAPGQEWSVAYALGRAITGRPGDVPRPPDIGPEAWSFAAGARHGFQPVAPAPQAPRPHHERSPVRFVAEELDLRVDSTTLGVEALYRFRNDGPEAYSQGILYPFPEDSTHPPPVLVDVEGFAFRRVPGGISFVVALGAGESRDVRIRYVQPVVGRSARYITRTTRNWGQPIEHARFVVRGARSLGPLHVTFPSTVLPDAEEPALLIEQTGFFPAHDLDIRW